MFIQNKKKPDFLLPGFQKCGTWALSHYLLQHPDVTMPKREIHYFDKFWHKGIDWYLSQLDNGKLVGEKTPAYVHHPERVHQVLPNAKFVFLLRNPVDRSFSHYWHYRKNFLEFRPFKRIIRNKSSPYIKESCYKEILQNWMKFFRKNQCMFILSKNFSKNRQYYMNKVFDFLGIDMYELEDLQDRNRTVMPKSRFVSFTLFPVAWLEKLSPFVSTRHLLRYFLTEVRKLNQGERYPKMDADVRRHLTNYFRECNKGLSNIIGIDVSKWWVVD